MVLSLIQEYAHRVELTVRIVIILITVINVNLVCVQAPQTVHVESIKIAFYVQLI
jgi:hypothetical protein